MIQLIIGLIFLGITVSVGVSQGYKIDKMADQMRKMAHEAVHEARSSKLPSLKGVRSPNPFGCGTYECHKRFMSRN
jgi:hypothetical protein